MIRGVVQRGAVGGCSQGGAVDDVALGTRDRDRVRVRIRVR